MEENGEEKKRIGREKKEKDNAAAVGQMRPTTAARLL